MNEKKNAITEPASLPAFENMPDEILFLILSHLSHKDLVAVSQLSTQFNSFTKELGLLGSHIATKMGFFFSATRYQNSLNYFSRWKSAVAGTIKEEANKIISYDMNYFNLDGCTPFTEKLESVEVWRFLKSFHIALKASNPEIFSQIYETIIKSKKYEALPDLKKLYLTFYLNENEDENFINFWGTMNLKKISEPSLEILLKDSFHLGKYSVAEFLMNKLPQRLIDSCSNQLLYNAILSKDIRMVKLLFEKAPAVQVAQEHQSLARKINNMEIINCLQEKNAMRRCLVS